MMDRKNARAKGQTGVLSSGEDIDDKVMHTPKLWLPTTLVTDPSTFQWVSEGLMRLHTP